jgi:membrane protein required for beta-lactamase induction
MFLQLHSQRAPQRDAFRHLADWWPAALIGLVALLGALPDSNAQTLLGF